MRKRSPPFSRRCRAILRSPTATRAERPVLGALFDICERAVAAFPLDDAGAREFFEKNFRPVADRAAGRAARVSSPAITSRSSKARDFPSDVYHDTALSPAHGPAGLAAAPRESKGKVRQATVVTKSTPYLRPHRRSRTARWPAAVWKSAGSTTRSTRSSRRSRARCACGSKTAAMLRLNYDAQNGHPYTAVGRFLVEREHLYARRNLDAEDPRMDGSQSGRRRGVAPARTSPTCSSARPICSEHEDPPGAQGVALTAGRSIAVDRNLHTYGMPFFIDAVLPIQSEKPDTRFPPADGRAGYRRRHHRAGARRHLSRRRRRGRARSRPLQAFRPLRDADAARSSIRRRNATSRRCRCRGRRSRVSAVVERRDAAGGAGDCPRRSRAAARPERSAAESAADSKKQ